jgi:hypothetical protein
MASTETGFYTENQLRSMASAVELLRDGREAILRDWVDRVRANQATATGQELSDPVLLDHVPQLFDAILDRLAIHRSREDAEQFAAVHGFARRLSGYNIAEMVLELLMLRRSFWAHLSAIAARPDGAYSLMEQIDGMVDRAILASLNAFLDPAAAMLKRDGTDAAGDAG